MSKNYDDHKSHLLGDNHDGFGEFDSSFNNTFQSNSNSPQFNNGSSKYQKLRDEDMDDNDDSSPSTYSNPHTDSPFLKSNGLGGKTSSLSSFETFSLGHGHKIDREKDDGSSSFNMSTVKGFFQYLYVSLRYTLYGDLRVALKYVHNNSKRNKKSLLLGLFTIFLVVLFISFLQNLIQASPIVFLKLSEDQTGELDLVITGDPNNYGSANTSLLLATPVYETSSEEAQYNKVDTREKLAEAMDENDFNGVSTDQQISRATSLLDVVKDTVASVNNQLNFIGDLSGYFVNSTFLNQTLYGASTVHGVAPRWLSIGNIKNANTDISASLILMVMNTNLEKSLNLGRGWTHPALVGNQIHITKSFLTRIGVEPNKGESVHLHMSFVDVLERLGTQALPTVKDITNVIEQYTQQPIPDSFNITALVDIYQSIYPSKNMTQVLTDMFDNGINITKIDATTYSYIIFPKIIISNYYSFFENDLTIDKELVVVDAIKSSGGKFPNSIGNVGVLESSFVEQLIVEKLDNISQQLNSSVFQNIVQLAEFVESIYPNNNYSMIIDQVINLQDRITNFTRQFKIDYYSMSSVVMLQNRVKIYTASDQEMMNGFMAFTNQIASRLGYSYPVTFTTPLSTTVQMFMYTKLSLNQIFNCVATVLLVLGALMIYSLLLSDVEGKTFEYGMLRAQGMRHYALILLLLSQALYFSIPGIIFGLFFGWCVYSVVAYFVYCKFVLLPIDLTFYSTSIISGLFMGLLMPIVANIAPIQRALSRTLRDALDVYHQVKNETIVKIMKLEEIGLDVLQTLLAVMAVGVGFTVYYLIPLSFTFRNYGLFFGILTGILMGMLFGMSMLAQAIQPFVEKAVIFCLILGKDRKSLYNLVRKNLFSHSSRNSKTATMLTISLTFVIFTGCVFRLQGHNIQELVRLGIGSDVAVVATSTFNPIPEDKIRAFLDNDIANNTQSIVTSYSTVTFPLDKIMNIRSTHLTTLASYPDVPVRVYGVEQNFLSSVFLDFYDYTELSKSLNFPSIKGTSTPDVISSLYVNQHKQTIPEDVGGVIVPPPSVISNGSVLYEPDNPIWWWVRNHLNNTYVYKNYTDMVISEAFRLTSGADTNTPFSLVIKYKQFEGALNVLNLLSKPQSMVGMFPSFFFSTYSQTSWNSPVLVNIDEFYNIMNLVFSLTSDPAVQLPAVPPKSKILVKLKASATQSQRDNVINGIRNFIKTDNIQVVDTQFLLNNTETAITILNLFFYVVSSASIILCFFMLWVSFSANIHENSWEFGVLRSIGLTSFQVTRVYIYEALVLIFSSMILGLCIGLGIALTLTLQFDLFTELPFSFEFPYIMFIGVLISSIFIAIFVSYQSSKEYRERMIASVLKGK
ncbi:hypothetical protein CYY_006230 [Polysphondylium violaceum]|uniref:ABC3 transporter permease C-terminal domain-containing protein n=1 Tax=Polysphondylium violaceum TaxID=133409 RepID=A0A8J4PTV5_9MYCE|nr:hypothetical protein CYY_006230 [Polysphondylium violaceum]